MHATTELALVWLILAATASLALVYAHIRRQRKTRKGNGQEASRGKGADNEHPGEEPEAEQGEPQQGGTGPDVFEEVLTSGENRPPEDMHAPGHSQGEADPALNQSQLQSEQAPDRETAQMPDVTENFRAPVKVGTGDEKRGADARRRDQGGREAKVPEPVERGGKPRGTTKTSKKPPVQESKVTRLKPEIVCWNRERQWAAGVEVPEALVGSSGLMVLQNGLPLTQDGYRDNCWPLKQVSGQALIHWKEDQIVVTLGEEDYLLFKLSGQDQNQGRQVKFASHGSYLVIAPDDWERDQSLSGTAPVEPEPTSLPGYQAHFFNLGREGMNRIAFCTPEGRKLEVESTGPKFELVGKRLSDASEGTGPLFGESPPKIGVQEGWAWKNVATIVVGPEGTGRGRWRMEFTPQPERTEQNLPPEIPARRGGWYFTRFYNLEYDLVDSLDFRFVSALTEISMPPTQPLPSENGHQPVIVKFHHTTDCTVGLTGHPASALVVEHGPTITTVTIPPDPAFDQTYWEVQCLPRVRVEVQLLVERIWWSRGEEHSRAEQTKKFDRPIAIERAAFSPSSNAVLNIWFPKPRWLDEVLVGFRQENRRCFSVKVNQRYVAIPLRDFGDAVEIQDRTQNATLKFWLVRDGIAEGGIVISEVLSEFIAPGTTASEPVSGPGKSGSEQIDFCSTCDNARISDGWVWCRRHHWDRVSIATFKRIYALNWCDEWQGEYQDAQGNWHIR